jgi:peptidyl-prolyl cis-trans isomerase SurA
MSTDNPSTVVKAARCRCRRRTLKLLGSGLAMVLVMFATAHAELVDRVVAVVNNDIILLSELDQMLAVMREPLNGQNYSPARKDQILKEQRKQVLDELIYDKLTDQQVRKYNIKIDDQEVDATIARIQKANKMSADDLRHALELDGLTYDQYRKQIEDQMLRSRLVNREVKSKIVITDEDVRAYYNARKKDYAGQTKYGLAHILIKSAPSSDLGQNDQAHQKINDIYKRLQEGESFEKLAGQYSEAPSAERNGHLGVFDFNLLSKPIQNALDGLGAKHFTKVVDTDQGYQIFYIETITHSGGRTIEEVRAEIQEKIYAQTVDQKFNDWIKDLRQHSHIQIMQ